MENTIKVDMPFEPSPDCAAFGTFPKLDIPGRPHLRCYTIEATRGPHEVSVKCIFGVQWIYDGDDMVWPPGCSNEAEISVDLGYCPVDREGWDPDDDFDWYPQQAWFRLPEEARASLAPAMQKLGLPCDASYDYMRGAAA